MTLDTQCLVLRPLTPADAEHYHAVVSDPGVRRFSTTQTPIASVEQYRAMFANRRHQTRPIFAATLKPSGTFIGICGFRDVDDDVKQYANLNQAAVKEITIQLLPQYRRSPERFGKQIIQVLTEAARGNRQRVIGIPHRDNSDSKEFLAHVGWIEWLNINDLDHSKYGFTIYTPKNQD